MSGGLLLNALLRETGRGVSAEQVAQLQRLHAEAYARLVTQVRPLPGARELLAHLTEAGVPWAIATSGRGDSARPALEVLGLGPDVPVITRDMVAYAKPDPDLFLAAADRLGVPITDSIVVGDSVWDLLAARRARAWASACSPAAMARTSSSAPAPIASIRTPPTSAPPRRGRRPRPPLTAHDRHLRRLGMPEPSRDRTATRYNPRYRDPPAGPGPRPEGAAAEAGRCRSRPSREVRGIPGRDRITSDKD